MSMIPEQKYLFTLEEVTDPQTRYLGEMNHWLELIFPEYCPSQFGKFLSAYRHPNGRHQIQIFVATHNDSVVGLAQQFYQEWQSGILADLDLLGVLQPFRRAGVALALVQECLKAIHIIAQPYQRPAIGLMTLIDPDYAPIVGLHQKLGGQIRTDYQYSSGDVIVWYPMQPEYTELPTSILVERLHQFGQLIECT